MELAQCGAYAVILSFAVNQYDIPKLRSSKGCSSDALRGNPFSPSLRKRQFLRIVGLESFFEDPDFALAHMHWGSLGPGGGRGPRVLSSTSRTFPLHGCSPRLPDGGVADIFPEGRTRSSSSDPAVIVTLTSPISSCR